MKEKYTPSPEDINKAEDMMTDGQKKMSKEREQTFEAGQKYRIVEDNNIGQQYESPKTIEDCKDLIEQKRSLNVKVKEKKDEFYRINSPIFNEIREIEKVLKSTPLEVLEKDKDVYVSKLKWSEYMAFTEKEHAVEWFKNIGIEVDDDDLKKTPNSYDPWQINQQDLERIFKKHGWEHFNVSENYKDVFIKPDNKK